jgi:hypothetical protein
VKSVAVKKLKLKKSGGAAAATVAMDKENAPLNVPLCTTAVAPEPRVLPMTRR